MSCLVLFYSYDIISSCFILFLMFRFTYYFLALNVSKGKLTSFTWCLCPSFWPRLLAKQFYSVINMQLMELFLKVKVENLHSFTARLKCHVSLYFLLHTDLQAKMTIKMDKLWHCYYIGQWLDYPEQFARPLTPTYSSALTEEEMISDIQKYINKKKCGLKMTPHSDSTKNSLHHFS